MVIAGMWTYELAVIVILIIKIRRGFGGWCPGLSNQKSIMYLYQANLNCAVE